jgi:hypothetical protein
MRQDKKPKPPPKQSRRRKEDNLQYSVKRARFLSRPENELCAFRKEGVCTYFATTIQHTKGREGKNFLDEETWLPSCAPCNGAAEEHDKEAREAGFKQSKHIGWKRTPKI